MKLKDNNNTKDIEKKTFNLVKNKTKSEQEYIQVVLYVDSDLSHRDILNKITWKKSLNVVRTKIID